MRCALVCVMVLGITACQKEAREVSSRAPEARAPVASTSTIERTTSADILSKDVGAGRSPTFAPSKPVVNEPEETTPAPENTYPIEPPPAPVAQKTEPSEKPDPPARKTLKELSRSCERQMKRWLAPRLRRERRACLKVLGVKPEQAHDEDVRDAMEQDEMDELDTCISLSEPWHYLPHEKRGLRMMYSVVYPDCRTSCDVSHAILREATPEERALKAREWHPIEPDEDDSSYSESLLYRHEDVVMELFSTSVSGYCTEFEPAEMAALEYKSASTVEEWGPFSGKKDSARLGQALEACTGARAFPK